MKSKNMMDGWIESILNSARNTENQRILLDIKKRLEDEGRVMVIALPITTGDAIKFMSAEWFIPEIIERIVWFIYSLYLKFELRIRIP